MRLIYWPDDLDILRVIKKYNADINIRKHSQLGGHWREENDESESNWEDESPQDRPAFYSRPSLGSRTDMTTGLQSVHRGFDFMTEEDGVSMRRIQSNLTSRHAARQQDPPDDEHKRDSSRSGHSLFPSLRRTLRRHGKNKSPPMTPP